MSENERKLMKQNKQMREALEKIVDKNRCDFPINCSYKGTTMTCWECNKLIAQQALKGIN